MNVDLRAIDSSLLARRPFLADYTTIGSAFFSVGVLLIFAEALFFEYFSSLAHSAFTTRRIIGFHLFPSEIWFIFIGNALLFLIVGNNHFRVEKRIFTDARPLFLVLGVYSLWFVYGSLAGNDWALQEFREMVFTALSLPPILYFASRQSAWRIVEKFLLPGVLAVLAISIIGAEDTALILATVFVSYFAFRLLYKSPWALIGLGLASLPFLLKFAKPMLGLFLFCVAASFVIAGHMNPRSVNWILSKFKIKIVLIGLSILLVLFIAVAAINAWSGGAIEQIIRLYFLKERLGASGDVVYGDMSGGRFAVWRAALESWLQRPLIGHGLGAEVEAYSKGWVTIPQFHNYIVQALHNTGLIGLLLIAGGWLRWLLRSLKKVYLIRDINEKVVLASMLVYVFGVLFYGLYGHSLSYPPSTQFFWLCVGFLCVLRRPLPNRVRL